MKQLRILSGFVVLLFLSHAASAQLIGLRHVDGKTVTCMRSGLTSDLKDCAGNTDWYKYVFIGRIRAIRPAGKDEKQIQIVPEEIFHGDPNSPITVVTSQGLCFPPMTVGERCLFYLRKKKGEPIVLDYYGNGSLPVKDAQEQIKTLRRLQSIGDFALLRGTVWRGLSEDSSAIPHATVIARRRTDGAQFIARSDEDGHYEFQPLSPGDYDITVMPSGPDEPDGSEVDLKRGACWDLALTRFPHTEIGGEVRSFDGSPVANMGVVLIDADGSGYLTTQTDRKGHFLFSMQEPGDYVVGINFPARADWFNGGGAGVGVRLPPASLFYPGVASRSSAKVIKLSTDERVDDIDFVIPSK